MTASPRWRSGLRRTKSPGRFSVVFGIAAAVAGLAGVMYMPILPPDFHMGMMLRGIKTNQTRMSYTGFNTRPYMLSAFVISGMYAGLAGGLLAVTDPLAGAERMHWTASGEVILMTILGGVGTLIGPVLGAVVIKYFENIFSAINEQVLHGVFAFLPDGIPNAVVAVTSLFVGDGWHLTLGALFMLIVIFLPGGIMEGVERLFSGFRPGGSKKDRLPAQTQPAE